MTKAQNLAMNWEKLLEYLLDHCLAPDLLTVTVKMMGLHLELMTDLLYPLDQCLASDLSMVPMMDGHLDLMMGHLQGFDLVRRSMTAQN